MKYIKLFEKFSEREVDSCDYFDFSSLDDFVEFKLPLYSIIAKRKTAKIVYMTPKQYMYKIANGWGLPYEDSMVAVSQEKVKKYAKAMKNGDKFPIGYYNTSTSQQEGRHRALAAMELGCNKIPVIELRNVGDNELKGMTDQYKNMSFDEIDRIFKSEGFDGISKLGYRELHNYFRYLS